MTKPDVLDKLKKLYNGSRFNRVLEAERKQGYRSAYRKSIKNKINQRDVNPIESEKERALIFLMVCEEVDGLVCKNGHGEEKSEFIREGVREIGKKAASTGITILDEEIATIEYMVDVLEEATADIKNKARMFLLRKDLRYSTVKIFMDKVKQEARPLTSILENVTTLMMDLDRKVDQIIYSQDEAIVTGEYSESTLDRQQSLAGQINEQIREARERLDVTVAAIRSVFADQY